MKKLFLSALMLTGVVAFAQEPKTAQDTTATTTTQTKVEKTKTQTPSSSTTTKSEATIKEDKEAKTASPAKKSK